MKIQTYLIKAAVLFWISGFDATLATDPKALKAGNFDRGFVGWMAFKGENGKSFGIDTEVRLALTEKADHSRDGSAALLYTYEVRPQMMRGLVWQQPLDLSEMRSLHFWLKSSHATILSYGLTEPNQATYQTAFYVPEKTWQQVSLNLDELVLDNRDDNRGLDLDQIQSMFLADASFFFINIDPTIKGRRSICLDDIRFSSAALPTTFTRNFETYLLDNFETPLIRWMPMDLAVGPSGFQLHLFAGSLDTDSDTSSPTGDQSLKFTYLRQQGRMAVLLRDVQKLSLNSMEAVGFWMKTSVDGMFLISLQERDESRYQAEMRISAADGWKEFTFPVGSLELAPGSGDENNKLDTRQLKQITVADYTGIARQHLTAQNQLWIDDFRVVFSP